MARTFEYYTRPFEYFNTLNENGLILFSDFNKAFDSLDYNFMIIAYDSLDHNFMIKCLQIFQIPNSIINWVDVFYKDAKSCIHNNFMIKCLQIFKIPNSIKNWVDVFYKDAKSCIHNNGFYPPSLT